jgi:hypothetical protein
MVQRAHVGLASAGTCQEGGVREFRAEVLGIDQDPAGISNVRIVGDDGPATLQTRCLVNAAAPFVKQVDALLGIDLPVRTELWEKIVIRDHLGIVPRTAPTVILKDELWLEWSDEERAWLRDDEEHRWLLSRFSSGRYVRPEGGAVDAQPVNCAPRGSPAESCRTMPASSRSTGTDLSRLSSIALGLKA